MDFFDFAKSGDFSYQVRFPMHGRLHRWSLRPDIPLDRGYLHLIEHVVVRANASRLTAVERLGGHYNAATTSGEMSLVLRTPRLDERIDLDDLTRAPWTEEDFEIEKRTIQQERALKCEGPGGSPNADAVIGSSSEIDAFAYDKLLAYRDLVRNNWMTISYGRDGGTGHVRHPTSTWSPHEQSELETVLTSEASELSPEDQLLRFFIRMVEMAAPVPRPWVPGEDRRDLFRAAHDGTARQYIKRHKSSLLLRYRLRLQNLLFFDQEFSAYLAIGLEPISVGAAFESFPFENALT